jgi:ABC-type glutathione transport system ATPase component
MSKSVIAGMIEAPTSVEAQAPLLSLEGISKSFHGGRDTAVAAVRSVDLTVAYGETVALVGESGSGKSTLARTALCLVQPDNGRVLLEGRCLTDLKPEALREARRTMQPIFQDPSTSFNPRRSVADALGQALWQIDPSLRKRRGIELLERVGLRPGPVYLDRYPHELSGGQRQRLAVARAIAMHPKLIIADEPLSGADVSIRGQMLNLLTDVRRDTGVAYLVITHDISIARAFADRVAVMCKGEIVECGPAQEVLGSPRHPYTQRLIASVPVIA